MRGLAALGLVLLWSCSGAKPIRQLLDHAFQFDARTVRIGGEVKAALQTLGSDVYQIDDGTGAIAVWTRTGNAMPRIGARLNVEGEFRSAFPFGAQLVPVLMEKQRRTQ